MPRRPRQYLPGMPYHIVQRGNNREACFFHIDDYDQYLHLLKTMMKRYGVQLHAYVLMTNHVHLIMTPEATDSISLVTKAVGSSYARYMNVTYKRTGSLWEGRHKASVIDSDNYLMVCYSYVELNPVVAKMVDQPEEYQWSSYTCNGWGDVSALITPHEVYLRLSPDVDERLRYYRTIVAEGISDAELLEVRRATHYCQPLGNEKFKKQIENKIGNKLGYMKPGRPKKVIG
jgi:putative transposase